MSRTPDLFRKSAVDLIRLIASSCDVQLAVARIDGHGTIASSAASNLLEAEKHLSSEIGSRDEPHIAFSGPQGSANGSIRFHAGVPLLDSSNRRLGTLAICDSHPKEMSDLHTEALLSGGRQLTGLLELAAIADTAKNESELFRSLVEGSAIAVYSLRNGRFSYVNTRFAETIGYTKDEILAFDSFLDIVPGEERETVQERIRQRHDGEVATLSYVTTVQRRDGSRLDAEIHGSTMEINGERIVIGSVLDVTARRSNNRELKNREEYFRVLTENIADVICISNADHVVTYISSSIESVLGFKVEERLGKQAFETANAADSSGLWASMHALKPGERLEPCEMRFRHKNGSWRSLEVHGTNLLHHPLIQGFVIIASDVTDRRRLEQELEQLNRLTSLGRLSAQVAHEFNNVLMGMQAPVDVIRRLAGDDPKMTRFAELLVVSIGRGKRITSDILRFGRPAQLTFRPVDAGSLLQAIGDEVRPLLPNVVTLQVEAPRSPLHVRADSAQFSQALMNLALNGKDAMNGEEGTLTIGARPGVEHTAKSIGQMPNSEHFVHFNVTDTGEGIRAEDLPFIFEPLYTTKKTGTGLGLSVVFQVIAGHGGHVFVETERGSGTTFHLFMPVAEVHPLQPSEAAPSERSPVRSQLRVLIIEDEVVIATGLRWGLEAEGMVVHTVGLAAHAIPAVDEFKPDVVVLDLSLPDADGRTVYQALLPRKVPVIFSTGSVGVRELAEGGHGSVAVLLKPYTSDDLVRTIHKVVAP